MHKVLQKALLLTTLSAFATSSFALQEKTIVNNDTANAFVSIKGLTRIAVQNDRILNVRGPDGAYELKEDNNQGAIFIHPSQDYQKKPFTLFIATETNQNYVLRVTPRDRNADTILLKPLDAQNPQAQHWETASPYTQAITHLMADMVNHNTPDGYVINKIVKPQEHYLGDIAIIKLTEIYEGAYLQGQIYNVTNRTGLKITLTEREFYQAGDRAIALTNLVVPPYGQTQLYKVVSHG